MTYKCKNCHSVLESDLHGFLECLKCKRSVPDPGYHDIQAVVLNKEAGAYNLQTGEFTPFIPEGQDSRIVKIQSHGLQRTEAIGGDAWVKEQPVFPLDEGDAQES